MIPTRHAADLVLGQWTVLGQLGGVPRLLVWDGVGGVGRYGGPNPKLTAEFTALRGMLGTRFYVCKPNDPETKGLTERNNGFFETSFLPGRRFTGPADLTPSWAGSWPGPTPASGARCRAPRPRTGSARTGRRWARYRPSTR
jgi:hypothetical protein